MIHDSTTIINLIKHKLFNDSNNTLTYNYDYLYKLCNMSRNKCRTFVDNPRLLKNKNININKLIIILDLDNTLVHLEENKLHVRQFAIDLIKSINIDKFETIIWTAGNKNHAKTILHAIDKSFKIKYCIYQGKWFCSQTFIKDLNLLPFNINNIIIVDDLFNCVQNNLKNAILIKSFDENYKDDNVLSKLILIFECLEFYNNVPLFLMECHILNKMSLDNVTCFVLE